MTKPTEHQYLIEGTNQHSYLHHNQQYAYQHSVSQTGNDVPLHHTFPRTSGQHFYTVPFDPVPSAGYGEAISRPSGTYPNRPQGYSSESGRPRLHVPPYPGQYQPRGQMNYARGQMPPGHNLHYQGAQQPNLHQQQQQQQQQQPPIMQHQMPNSLPRQMHPKQQQMNYHPRGQRPQMPQGQRPSEINIKSQPRYFMSQMCPGDQQLPGVTKPGYVGRPVQMDPGNYAMTEEHSKNFHQGLLNIARQEEHQREVGIFSKLHP